MLPPQHHRLLKQSIIIKCISSLDLRYWMTFDRCSFQIFGNPSLLLANVLVYPINVTYFTCLLLRIPTARHKFGGKTSIEIRIVTHRKFIRRFVFIHVADKQTTRPLITMPSALHIQSSNKETQHIYICYRHCLSS